MTFFKVMLLVFLFLGGFGAIADKKDKKEYAALFAIAGLLYILQACVEARFFG